MGSPCLFTRQQALKIRYFYWLLSNHRHTELNLGYFKGTKFFLESEASFIDISSIASFKPFLIAWLTVPWLPLSPRLGQNTPSWEPFSEKKLCSIIKVFFLFKYVLHQTVLSKYLKKKLGVTVLV